MPFTKKQEKFLHAKNIKHKHDYKSENTCQKCGGELDKNLMGGKRYFCRKCKRG